MATSGYRRSKPFTKKVARHLNSRVTLLLVSGGLLLRGTICFWRRLSYLTKPCQPEKNSSGGTLAERCGGLGFTRPDPPRNLMKSVVFHRVNIQTYTPLGWCLPLPKGAGHPPRIQRQHSYCTRTVPYPNGSRSPTQRMQVHSDVLTVHVLRLEEGASSAVPTTGCELCVGASFHQGLLRFNSKLFNTRTFKGWMVPCEASLNGDWR
jgi:hypothetical protein